MSEGIIIALIGFAGAILGALISGLASIVAANMKGKSDGQGSTSCAVTGLIASIGGVGGLILGALFGVFLYQKSFTAPNTAEPIYSGNSPSSNIAPLIISDITNNKVYNFDFPGNNVSSSCSGGYLETKMNEITYQLTVPDSWVVIIDSWKANWSSGDYQNDGILIISGNWQGTVTINTGAICAVSINSAEVALDGRRAVNGYDGRPEFTIP